MTKCTRKTLAIREAKRQFIEYLLDNDNIWVYDMDVEYLKLWNTMSDLNQPKFEFKEKYFEEEKVIIDKPRKPFKIYFHEPEEENEEMDRDEVI